MALRTINPNETREYIPESEIGNEKPTIFGLRPVTGDIESKYVSELYNSRETKGRGSNSKEIIDPNKTEYAHLNHFCRIVKYIKNMTIYNDDGTIKFIDYTDDVRDIRYIGERITTSIRSEIFEKVQDFFSLTEVEKKS
jgi:hypothetical protein